MKKFFPGVFLTCGNHEWKIVDKLEGIVSLRFLAFSLCRQKLRRQEENIVNYI